MIQVNLYGCSAKFIKVSMMPVFCITLASVPVFSSNGLLTVGICGLIGLTVAAVFIHLLAIRLFRRTLDLADVIDVDRNTVRRAQFEHIKIRKTYKFNTILTTSLATSCR